MSRKSEEILKADQEIIALAQELGASQRGVRELTDKLYGVMDGGRLTLAQAMELVELIQLLRAFVDDSKNIRTEIPGVPFRYRVEYMTDGNPEEELQGFKGEKIFTEAESARSAFDRLNRNVGTTSVELWQERCLRHN